MVVLKTPKENGLWPLGLVTEARKGTDGLVRSVKVKVLLYVILLKIFKTMKKFKGLH